MNTSEEDSVYFSLLGAVGAALIDGFKCCTWHSKTIAGKEFNVRLSTVIRVISNGNYQGIKRGGWMYSPSMGVIRNNQIKEYFLLQPFPLPKPFYKESRINAPL